MSGQRVLDVLELVARGKKVLDRLVVQRVGEGTALPHHRGQDGRGQPEAVLSEPDDEIGSDRAGCATACTTYAAVATNVATAVATG